MSMSEKKKEFFLDLLGYSVIIFLVGLTFCILYFEVEFYNIWIFIKKLTVVSIENWYVSLPILGIIVGFIFIIISSMSFFDELYGIGCVLVIGSFLILVFLSAPVASHLAKEKLHTKIEEIIQEWSKIS